MPGHLGHLRSARLLPNAAAGSRVSLGPLKDGEVVRPRLATTRTYIRDPL
jgi:hypothetical protein